MDTIPPRVKVYWLTPRNHARNARLTIALKEFARKTPIRYFGESGALREELVHLPIDGRERPTKYYAVAMHGKSIVGVMNIALHSKKDAQFEYAVTLPAYRKKGIFRKIFAETVRWMGRKRISTAQTVPVSPQAVEFLEDLAWPAPKNETNKRKRVRKRVEVSFSPMIAGPNYAEIRMKPRIRRNGRR